MGRRSEVAPHRPANLRRGTARARVLQSNRKPSAPWLPRRHAWPDAFKTHPQPRTFAPSKEDVLQNLQYFFGAPVSPEKLKDYSEHHAMTCASLSARFPLPYLQTAHVRRRLRRPLPRRVRRQQHQDPRHAQQPHPQVPAELADVGWPSLLPDRGHRCRVGRGPLRRAPDAAGAVRGRVAHADVAPPSPPRPRRAPRSGSHHRVGLRALQTL